MRVIQVNCFARVTGGADTHCLALMAGLRERGHDVVLLSTSDPRNIETSGEFVRCRVTHESRDSLGAPAKAAVAAAAAWNREAAAAMRDLVERFQPNVVHLHKLYPQLSVAPAVVARRLGVPVVQTVHDYEFVSASPFDSTGQRIDRRDSRAAYRALNTTLFGIKRTVHRRLVNEWISVSDYVAQVMGRGGISTHVVPNFGPGTRAPRTRDAREGVAFVGRLHDDKGIHDVIELARRLPNTRVSVAGAGPCSQLVREATSRVPSLEFLGELDHESVVDLFARSCVAVVPSRWDDPAPLVVLEALSVGTPVVAYERGGLPEYIRTSGAGLVVEPDPAGLASACEALLGDADLWGRMSQAALLASDTTYSLDAYCRQLEDVYTLVIS